LSFVKSEFIDYRFAAKNLPLSLGQHLSLRQGGGTCVSYERKFQRTANNTPENAELVGVGVRAEQNHRTEG
jgi:hypothetical protein